MKAFISGGAGFIGSNLVDSLISDGYNVTVFDNFSTGLEENLEKSSQSTKLRVVKGDLLNKNEILHSLESDTDIVYHFSANADVRFGFKNPKIDLEQNTIATFNILEAMRQKNVTRIVFSSTGSVYGEPSVFPTPESVSIPIQTSLYAASKVAGEAMLQAYSSGYKFEVFIFRFVSVMGERYSHGHVFDFCKQLRDHPEFLNVLGNGKQTKSYLHVEDCIAAMNIAIKKSKNLVNIYNLGTDETCQVVDSIGWIEEVLGLNPKRNFTGGKRGWIGDSPLIHLDTTKIQKLGWKPKKNIESSIRVTAEWLSKNQWIFSKRT